MSRFDGVGSGQPRITYTVGNNLAKPSHVARRTIRSKSGASVVPRSTKQDTQYSSITSCMNWVVRILGLVTKSMSEPPGTDPVHLIRNKVSHRIKATNRKAHYHCAMYYV